MKFIVYEKKIKENIQFLKEFGRVDFPLKANCAPEVLQHVEKYRSNEDGYLVSSVSHIEVLIRMGISTDRMVYMNICSSTQLMAFIYSLGVRSFCFGDIDSMLTFKERFPDIYCILRVATSNFSIKASKLGVKVTDLELAIKSRRLNGFSFDIQMYKDKKSGLSDEFFMGYVNILRNKLLEAGVPTFNFRLGGLSKDFYASVVKKADKCDIDVDVYLKRTYGDIIFEIGKHLLKDSVNCYVSVTAVYGNTIYIDSGVYGGLLDVHLRGRKFKIKSHNVLWCRSCKELAYGTRVLLCGNSCDTLDVIGEYYLGDEDLSEIKEGTLLTLLDVGSYVDVFQMNYCQDIAVKYETVGW